MIAKVGDEVQVGTSNDGRLVFCEIREFGSDPFFRAYPIADLWKIRRDLRLECLTHRNKLLAYQHLERIEADYRGWCESVADDLPGWSDTDRLWYAIVACGVAVFAGLIAFLIWGAC